MSPKLKKVFYGFYIIGIIRAIFINIELSKVTQDLLSLNVVILEYIATGSIVVIAVFLGLNFIKDFSFKTFQYFRFSFILAVLIAYIIMLSSV